MELYGWIVGDFVNLSWIILIALRIFTFLLYWGYCSHFSYLINLSPLLDLAVLGFHQLCGCSQY
jgi:hypothetical protein